MTTLDKTVSILTDLVAYPSVSSESNLEIINYLSDKIAKWWLPDDVIFVDELPHGATGKLVKTGLREEYKNHLIDSK